MARPLKREKSITRKETLRAAAKLFHQKGYQNTRVRDIAEEAGVSYNEVFRLFEDKDTILSEIVGIVLECQFETAEEVLKDKNISKLYYYAFESVLQLYMAETYDHIREMYVVSYSLPHSLNTVHKTLTIKLEEFFKDLLPELETKDFYELEIASAGIMRGYLSVPCNMYFNIDRKVKRFIESNFKIYDVSKETISDVEEFLKQFDFKNIAINVLEKLKFYFEERVN